MKTHSRIPLELIFWVAALVLLALAQPAEHGDLQHFTLCPLANLGFDWCSGCGIGRSITSLIHGDVSASLGHHWFGIPALLTITYRVLILIKLSINTNDKFKLI